MITDPQKVYKGDPGNPEICPVFALHQIYTDEKDLAAIDKKCRSGELGCADDKKHLIENLNASLEPLRKKRKELEMNKDYVLSVLDRGAAEARERAEATMAEVRKSMNLVRIHA